MKMTMGFEGQRALTLGQKLANGSNIKRGLRVASLELKGHLQVYPTQGNTVTDYVRTGTLRRGWDEDGLGSMEVTLFNDIYYANYVQGNRQPDYFRRVWHNHTIFSIARRKSGRMARVVAMEWVRTL